MRVDDGSPEIAGVEAEPRLPLSGVLVIEFGSLVPGPMTGLFLAEAGARVIKIERPPEGDPMRGYEPKIAGASGQFHLMNRGKTSLFVDLKDREAQAELLPLLRQADVIIEQFRPGVMDRLGLGYESIRALNPSVIYCSLTGWGQFGANSRRASHDLNVMAESGLLDQIRGADGFPVLPHAITADLAGGVYPAVLNIVLAILQRQTTGQGLHLDIAASDGLGIFNYDRLVLAESYGIWPQPGRDQCTGGSPRYQIYRTRDERYIAVAAMEDRFWRNFCDLIDLPARFRHDDASPELVKAAVAARVSAKDSKEWASLLSDHKSCCSLIATLQEAMNHQHTRDRGLYTRGSNAEDKSFPVLPIPIVAALRSNHALDPLQKEGSSALSP